MKEKIQILLIALLLAVALILAGFASGWLLRGRQMQTPTADPIIIRTIDTVTLTEQIHDTITQTYYKTIKVPFHDTIALVDSVWVTLPFERHFASLDSVADVWYSGYEAKIDSARIYKTHTTEIINHYTEVAKTPRLTLDVGVGAFYHESRVNPYLVGEMRYNAPRTTFSAYGAVDHQGRLGAGAAVSYRINLVR